MKKYLHSTYLLYICILIILSLMLFIKNVHIEYIDMGFIKQILHPEYPKGELAYDPLYHYNYIVAYVIKWLGYEDNFTPIAMVFWFLEMGIVTLALIKLCNLLFTNHKLILILVIAVFILLKSGETDQKTMASPLYLLAIYYFLKEKWSISALFGASIFYLHVGLAIWWFLPSFFALLVIFLIGERISLQQIIKYLILVIILASPVIYFYLRKGGTLQADEFSTKYFYYVCASDSSVLLTFSSLSVPLLNILTPLGVFLVGYSKAQKSGYRNNNIMPIVIGVLILYVGAFVFADMLGSGIAIRLQLLRSILNIEVFSKLFFAFLLARQIERGNYIFFLAFVIFSLHWYTIVGKFLGITNQNITMAILYLVMLIYEIFESHILHFIRRINEPLMGRFNIEYLKAIVTKSKQLFPPPIVIAVFLISMSIPLLPITKPLKSYIKSYLKIPQHDGTVAWTVKDYLHKDIADFTNQKITDKNTLLVVPFYELDFEFYTNHKTFITYFTPLSNLMHKTEAFDFKDILEKDFGYSLDNLIESMKNGTNDLSEIIDSMWRNLNEDIIRGWKEKYKVTHVIREKGLRLDFPILYQNQYYVVYEIK